MRKCRDINLSDISDVSMGVSVLQIYPAQPDKTGPQIIDTLTRRIMNLGEQIKHMKKSVVIHLGSY
jgi:hypothetical protein